MTLLEVVFGLAILASGMLVVAQVIVSSHRLTRETTERSHARAIAEARLSELRTLLHRAAWTPPWDQTTHDAQFQLVVDEDSFTNTAKARTVDLLDDTNSGTNRIPATVNVKVYSADETAIATAPATGNSGGLGLADVDLDCNGATTDTSAALADLRCIGVKVEVTRKPGGWQAGQPDAVLRLCALLY
jgi:type II secretory pathway pseudopilin PulG